MLIVTDDGGGVDIGREQFSVTGAITALAVDGLSVKGPERSEPVRCTFKPRSELMTVFAVGQWVSMTCACGDGRLVLVSLTHEDPPPPPSDVLSGSGTLASLDGGQVAVAVDGPTAPSPARCRPG